MLDFIKQGGVPSLVIILFSFLALMASVMFARRPDEKSRAMIRALTNVVITSIVLGTFSAFYAVLRYAAAHPEEPLHEVLVVGGSEALTPAILGLSFLSVVYMFVAVGERRLRG